MGKHSYGVQRRRSHTFRSSYPLKLLKIIYDTKEPVFLWIITFVFLMRIENILKDVLVYIK